MLDIGTIRQALSKASFTAPTSSSVIVFCLCPAALASSLPPNTRTESGPNRATSSRAFLYAPSVAATIKAIEDIPSATLSRQKKVLSLKALTALIDWDRRLKSLFTLQNLSPLDQ